MLRVRLSDICHKDQTSIHNMIYCHRCIRRRDISHLVYLVLLLEAGCQTSEFSVSLFEKSTSRHPLHILSSGSLIGV